MLTTPSSLFSTVALQPLSRRIPIPLDPAHMPSNDVMGWKTQEIWPGQNAEIMLSEAFHAEVQY